jgi:hypothetical protein
MIFQILLILFAVFAILHTSRQYKRQTVSVRWTMAWTLFWLVVIAVALAPQTTDVIAQYVGIERGSNLIVYCAIVILAYGMYRVYTHLERLHREMTRLTREVAIRDAKKK